MEAAYIADRTELRLLWCAHPDWPIAELARQMDRSPSWARKWIERFRADPANETLVWGMSRARVHPPPSVSSAVVQQILAIRDHPPQGLRRIPGPKAILYYLLQSPSLDPAWLVPRSTRTIWRILRAHDRIAILSKRRAITPIDRPVPLTHWQIDFKDVSSVLPEPEGKRTHVVEAFNAIDVGTALLLMTAPRADYHAGTVFAPLIATMQQYGVPQQVTFDRDPRFVGSHTGRDFPSPFVRFWLCLGVAPNICPPRRPDRNGCVERFHRTLAEECLALLHPPTLEATQEILPPFQQYYNHERPHQSVVCGNRPPAVAHPNLPVLPTLPSRIDPDGWLTSLHKHRYARRVKTGGIIEVQSRTYYVKADLVGQEILLEVDAPARQLLMWHQQHVIKRVPIKGLVGHELAFDEWVTLLEREALAQWRRYQQRIHIHAG